MSEELNINKLHYDKKKIIGAQYALDAKEHNMEVLLELSNELKKDYPEIPNDKWIQVFKPEGFKDSGPLVVTYTWFKNKKLRKDMYTTNTKDIYKLYDIKNDYVWFEYFTTIGNNDVEHLSTLANEIYKDFPNVNAADIQIKNDRIKYISRKYYLRFSVLKKYVNLRKLGKRVINADDVSHGDNSFL